MIVLLSPAKSLDYGPTEVKDYSIPRLLDNSEQLVSSLKKQSVGGLKKLMKVSDKIAALNVERYQQFQLPFNPDNAKQAILTFNGDVYTGLQAATFDKRDMKFAQKHIRILSGLYGLLKPLDLMQAYRLEMGTSLKTRGRKNLYEFWNERITELINEDAKTSKSKLILNLASQEYFKSVKADLLDRPLLHVHFKEWRDDKLKVISFNAKKARGAMAHLIVKTRINKAEELKQLDVDGYRYQQELSDEQNFVFAK
ncbi:MAG: peroxide stress protein YaaA [Bacteroidota bacterium]